MLHYTRTQESKIFQILRLTIRNKIVLETSISFKSNILTAIFFKSLIAWFRVSLIIVSYRIFYLYKNQKFQSGVKLLVINSTSKAIEIFMAGNKRRTKNNKIAWEVSFFKKSSFSNSKHIVELKNHSTLIHKDRSMETVQDGAFIFRWKKDNDVSQGHFQSRYLCYLMSSLQRKLSTVSDESRRTMRMRGQRPSASQGEQLSWQRKKVSCSLRYVR